MSNLLYKSGYLSCDDFPVRPAVTVPQDHSELCVASVAGELVCTGGCLDGDVWLVG